MGHQEDAHPMSPFKPHLCYYNAPASGKLNLTASFLICTVGTAFKKITHEQRSAWVAQAIVHPTPDFPWVMISGVVGPALCGVCLRFSHCPAPSTLAL